MNIQVKIDGHEFEVPRAKYVTNTLQRLVEFGYSTLTRSEVEEAVECAIEGKEKDDVVFIFISGEVCKQ